MKGGLEQLNTLSTSGTRVAGLLQKPSQLVCGIKIDPKTFDVGASRRLGTRVDVRRGYVETNNGGCSGRLASVVRILTNVLGT